MTTLPLQGKVIAITGGASGIGLATAHLLASRGATLSLADVREDQLNKAVEEIRANALVEILPYVLDVRKPEQVDAWIQKTVQTFGKLDGAANVAGVIGKSIGVKGIVDQDEDEWDFVIGINLTGVMHCLRAQMKVIENGGSIVNVSSIAGLMGRPLNAAYAASKHGVIGLTRSAAKEIGSQGTRVNSIAPGAIKTPMANKAGEISNGAVGAGAESLRVPLGRLGNPDEPARLIAFLLGDESKFITGATYSIDGGWFC